MTTKSINSLNSLNAVYQYLVQQELIGRSIPRDAALTLIAPVSTLALALETSLPAHEEHLEVLVLAQHPLAGISNGLFYNLLPHLSAKYASGVSVTVVQEGKQLQTPYDTESRELLKENIVTLENTLSTPISDYDFVFWPSPNNVDPKACTLINQWVKTANNSGVPVLSTHHSVFDRTAESMAAAASGIRIEECSFFGKKKNPYSVHTNNDNWGLVWGQVHTFDEYSADVNRIKLCTQVLRHIMSTSSIEHEPGEIGYASNHTKYPVRQLLSDISINAKDLAIFKARDNSFQRVGSLTTHFQQTLSGEGFLNEKALLAAIELIMACGLPFGNTEKEQQEIEQVLEAASLNGSAHATLALAAYAERRGNIETARALYGRCPKDPYCLYHAACIDYESDKNINSAVPALYQSAQLGLPCASATLYDIVSLEPKVGVILQQHKIDLGELVKKSAESGDPAALKIVAREQAAVQDLQQAENALYRAARQGDIEAIHMINDLYSHFKSNNQLTGSRKKRAKLFKQLAS